MTGQEARDDELEALAYTPTTADVREAVAECSWSRRMFRPELAQTDGQEFDRWLVAHDAALLARKHPEPEITDEMVKAAIDRFHEPRDETWEDAMRATLEAAIAAALGAPLGEGEQSNG